MGDFQTFISAVKDGNLKDVMKSFQTNHTEMMSYVDANMLRRPIHWACWNGHLEIVKFLFQNKCSLECEDENKMQPIHFACQSGNLEVVKFLFQNKCSLECEDKNKKRPIHFACQSGNLEVVKFLFQNNCGIECEDNLKQQLIHFACDSGNLEIVKFLFQNKCGLECEDKNNKRLIHLACRHGNLEIVKFLLENKCSLECEDKNKKRPIHFACESGNLEIIKFLFKNNCSFECEDKWNKRPIHLACEIGNLEIIKFLFQNKCILESENKWKKRPIHLACEIGNLEIVKFLFQNKCSIECEDNNKWRPIHFACYYGHQEIIKFLILSNCEVDCKTKTGDTPIEICQETCTNSVKENIKLREIFDCVRRNDAQAFGAVYSPDILMMEQHTGFSLIEIALEEKAVDIIDYILNKLNNTKELSALENYRKTSQRSDVVQIIQECILYRSIRFYDADGFHVSCLAKTINEHGKLVKTSFLEVAAEYGCKAFIHVILKKSIYNDEEWTKAKDLAIVNGHTEIAEAISARKSLLRNRADKCFTWLHSAVCDNDPDMVKYILEKDLVNPNFNNEVVGTALALAYMMCYEECIKVLEKYNVDINTQNQYSQSPLHEAIASGMIDHCSYVITRANDIDRPGFLGFTGLQYAVIKGCEKLCEELVKNGADCVRYVEIFQQSAFSKTILPISKYENAVTLCAKIHRKIYPCFLQELESDEFKCSDVQSVMTSEIFHLAIPDGDPKTILSLFEKCHHTVQQAVIEDLLHHFVSKDNYNDFVNLLKTEIVEPKWFPNGETLFTNLLKQMDVKYCWAIINCEKNTKYIVSPNAFKETPLQIAIESELFDLVNPLILNCENDVDLRFNWDILLISLFEKLSMSTNNDTDQKLLAAINGIILRGGDIYKKSHGGLGIINYCTRFKERIEKFQKNAGPKQRDEKNICSVCLDREVNCVLDCGHTFCMGCGPQLYRCAICNSETTNPKKLYFN